MLSRALPLFFGVVLVGEGGTLRNEDSRKSSFMANSRSFAWSLGFLVGLRSLIPQGLFPVAAELIMVACNSIQKTKNG